MSLRKRLLLLLSAFGVYAVVAAGVSIYGSHWHVEASLARFERTIGQTMELDRLQLLLTEQVLHLSALVDGRVRALDPYTTAREAFSTTLQQATAFSPNASESPNWRQVLRLAESFEDQSSRCLAFLQTNAPDQAHAILTTRLDEELVPALRLQLERANTRLNAARNQSAHQLASTSARIFVLTIAVGIIAGALVVVGALLIHRWLMRPLASLSQATQRYSEGDLSFRTSIARGDELGQLGSALNNMAESLAASAQKHRTLFSNLRDAVVICDEDGRIVEYHDGDSRLLSVDDREQAGRHLLEVWPEWEAAFEDWPAIIHRTVTVGRRHVVSNIRIASRGQEEHGTIVDFVIYRVEFGGQRYVAVVIRDATERNRLEKRLRTAKIMEAVGTMAGGFAHDVNNLLTDVIARLAVLASGNQDAQSDETIGGALKACRRAAGLSKRLLGFARGAHGTCQLFAPSDIVKTVLESMDPSFLQDIEVDRNLDFSVRICMDQDQFAQVVLNLLRNARDAMTAGGRLSVTLRETRARHPDQPDTEKAFAALVFRDSGTGMTPDVEQRVFEPFFSTKSRAEQRGRGMGLAIVYSTVTNAGGYVNLESQPNVGTTISVFLPVAGQDEADVRDRSDTFSERPPGDHVTSSGSFSASR